MKKAFTLLELIIVLAIISIVIAIPMMKISLIEDRAADIEVENFINDYNLARKKAMAIGIPYYLDLRKDFYYLNTTHSDETTINDPKSKAFKHISYAYSDTAVEFKPDGYASTVNNGTYELVFINNKSKKIRKFTISALTGYLNEK
ncbi:type II secretion system protein [Anaerococcus sp. Marseille-P3915]|uniref:type II secretion system protein n=1 Tax=Anaerococcus sp. Marseille-P3915 TaxID=2057799 RepID=UPI000D0AF9E4|nr:type II secretion system protein [Anaerococcus sp. Marseille-P3915]